MRFISVKNIKVTRENAEITKNILTKVLSKFNIGNMKSVAISQST